MPAQTRVPTTEITGLQGRLMKFMMRKMLGDVPTGAEVMWHDPAVFKDMMRMNGRAEKWQHLDENLAALAAMAAAAEIGCEFCLDLGYFAAHNKGLDVALMQEVPRWRESTAFSSLQRMVMEYAAAMCQTPPAVTDELSAGLLAALGAPALIDLTAKVAVMNANSRMNVTLAIPSQEYAASCGLRPMADRGDAAPSTP